MVRTVLSVVVLALFCLNVAAEEKAKGPTPDPKAPAAKPTKQEARPQAKPETPQAKRIAEIKAEIEATWAKCQESQKVAAKAHGEYLQAQFTADGLKLRLEGAKKRLQEAVVRAQVEEQEAFHRKAAFEKEQNVAKQLGALQQEIFRLKYQVAELTAKVGAPKVQAQQAGEQKQRQPQQDKKERKHERKQQPAPKQEPKK